MYRNWVNSKLIPQILEMQYVTLTLHLLNAEQDSIALRAYSTHLKIVKEAAESGPQIDQLTASYIELLRVKL